MTVAVWQTRVAVTCLSNLYPRLCCVTCCCRKNDDSEMFPPYDDTAFSCKGRSVQAVTLYCIKSTWEDCAKMIVQKWSQPCDTNRGCTCTLTCLKQTPNLFCEYSGCFAACTTPVNTPRCLMLNMNVRCFSSAAGGRESAIKTAAWIQHKKCTSAREANESEIVMWRNQLYNRPGNCGLFE